MSEKEQKRRQDYRKNRERWIFAQTVIVAVLTLAVIISSLVAYQLEKTYYVGYREHGNIDYNVFLKDNEFFDKDYLGKDQSYVASLIDNIVANFTYEIELDTEDVNYRYSYDITAKLEIIDNTSGVAIFKPEYELVKAQNRTQSSSNRLVINEIVVLNYDNYNSLAGDFLATYDLDHTTSNIVVTLKVDVLSECNAFLGSSADTYFSELRIPLTTKTVNIKMTSTVPDAEAKMIACTRGAGSEVFKTTAIVLGVVDVILLLILVAFIYLTRTDDITYTARVKKIVSQYKSYIQRIKNVFDMSAYQVVVVDTFDEMLEIRDTIQAPILMHENEDKTCAKFIIPTDNKLLYLYEIKIDGYTEPEPEPKIEPAPTTICKPQITNVVRPVVKVMVTPKPDPNADVNTVIEEAEVEADEEDIDVSCEVIEEETITDEDLDILDAIPMVEEEIEEELIAEVPGVDAIDVFWDGKKENSYRYDPDGNSVEEGDVVLVPTRDEENDKDIVREAEVLKGNYKVDPAELDSPLKKIIGVVRRRAEKVFVAMITPDEETENSEK